MVLSTSRSPIGGLKGPEAGGGGQIATLDILFRGALLVLGVSLGHGQAYTRLSIN